MPSIQNITKRTFLTACLLLVAFCQLRAQIYPVQISTQLVPPYSGYLPDYADPSSEKMKVIMHFNDFSVPQYNIKLVFEIKGNGFSLKTKSFFNPAPISISPGQPLLLSSIDLAPYLNSSNLDFIGINKSQYESRMALPEGYYSICVTAYDYYSQTPIQVSNEACAQAWFTLSDPPFLNLPICNSVVTPLTPQNVLFQWTPMNLGSPNSGMNTEYEFSLWESRPDSNAIPNQVVQSTQPVFTTTTSNTFYNYGILETPLNLYMKYIWRVRAIDITGRDWFKNNGYSQICTFKYGSLKTVIGGGLALKLYANSLSYRAGQAYWTKQGAYTSYTLNVRKLGTQNWFEYENQSGIEKIMNLEENTSYECKVIGEGNGLKSDWSNVETFKTPPAPVYSCNDPNNMYNTAPPDPLPFVKAIPGLIVQSGQFKVLVGKIQSSGAPGWYSGQGFVTAFGKRISVKWTNIYLDADANHQQGTIEALTNGIDKWLAAWDLLQAEENALYVEGSLDTVLVKGNKVCYTFQGSANEICVTPPPNQNIMVIRDADGNEYEIKLIPPPPKVTGPKNYFDYSGDSLDASENKMVTFETSTGQSFGFDKKEYTAFYKNYEIIKLKNNKNYFVANKSVGESSTDQVLAKVTIENFNSSLLTFKKENGSTLSHGPGNGPNSFLVSGISSDANCVYAWYDNKKIGKLRVHSLNATTKKIVLIPVNGSTLPQNLAADLNLIYKQANVNFSVTTAGNFTFDLQDGKMGSADASILSKYSAEMKSLRGAYREQDTAYDSEAAYLFIVPAFTNPEQLGYMARGKALGFLKSGASSATFAHELAHGLFAFTHTFPDIEKNTTNNLMDYGGGTQMVLEQWKKTKIKPDNFNWFDGEDDGSMFGNERGALETFRWLAAIKLAYKKATSFTLPDHKTDIDKTGNCYLAGVQYDYIEILIPNYTSTTTTRPRNGMSIENYDPGHGAAQKKEIVIDNGRMKIRVPELRLNNMLLYLKDTFMYKNLIVFCNGYRPIVNFNDGVLVNHSLEYANTDNACEDGDCRGYWKGIDQSFMNRIGDRYAVFFDGHHLVETSNHLSVQSYMAGNIMSDYIRSSIDTKPGLGELTVQNRGAAFLHTTPNLSGFNTRAASGEQGARNLIARINAGTIIFNKATDVIDIVAHSMGYAYSVGLIRELKKNGFKFGRYYILAPENACSGGVDLTWFEEVWQYGSNYGEQNEDVPWLQDGVAPQCAVPGFGPMDKKKYGRVFIPLGVETKSYLGSHSVGNYTWIFNRSNNDAGYVRTRN
jgi:hypothetical protein